MEYNKEVDSIIDNGTSKDLSIYLKNKFTKIFNDNFIPIEVKKYSNIGYVVKYFKIYNDYYSFYLNDNCRKEDIFIEIIKNKDWKIVPLTESEKLFLRKNKIPFVYSLDMETYDEYKIFKKYADKDDEFDKNYKTNLLNKYLATLKAIGSDFISKKAMCISQSFPYLYHDKNNINKKIYSLALKHHTMYKYIENLNDIHKIPFNMRISLRDMLISKVIVNNLEIPSGRDLYLLNELIKNNFLSEERFKSIKETINFDKVTWDI